jgi:catecholate siderophore receptor
MTNRSSTRIRFDKPRRHGRSRLFVLGATLLASGAAAGRLTAVHAQEQSPAPAAPGAGRAPRTLPFDVPAGTIGSAIERFRSITGIEIVFASDMLRELPSPGVSGLLTAEEALERLLAGTAVGFTFTTPSAARLDLRASSVVNVDGEARVLASPKYTQPLRDVPQTIALIPRATIEEQGATTLSDVLRNVPGITLQAGEGGGASNTAGDMFNMRGFNASNSLFVDGVRDDGLISRDVFNIEQVEVFMGPTGLDVGRGTAAGYVNMQSKAPHMDTAVSIDASYGTAEQGRMSADFNWGAPASADGRWLSRAGIRLNALWQDGGVPGRDAVDNQTKAIAPSVALGLGTPTRVTLGAHFIRQDNVPDYGIPGAAWDEEPLAPTTVLASRPVEQSNFYGTPGFDYDRASQDTYLARVEHDVTRTLTARNQTRYNRTHRTAVISTIQNPAAFNSTTELVAISRQGNERENEILSNQSDLVGRFSTGRLRHGLSTGIEFASEQQFTPTLGGVGTRAATDVYVPDHNAPVTAFAPARTPAYSRGRTSTVGLYAFDAVDLSPKWQVSGGVRWEYYDTTFHSVDAVGVTTTDLPASDSLVSSKAGVLFRATEQANLYFSYGTTLTPPGAANFALSSQPNNQNNPSVEPQKSRNYEVGAKWDVSGGRLSLTGAVFHTENENVIFTVDATAVPPIYNQDDAQRVNGVTGGAVGQITDRWEVLANIGFLDSEQVTQNTATNGLRLTLTPEWSGSVWTTYRFPIGLRTGGGVRLTSEVFVNAANTIRSPGYAVVDGLVEYDLNSHLTLRLNIYNLTDETYIRNVNNNGGRYNPGAPRSATVTTSVRF